MPGNRMRHPAREHDGGEPTITVTGSAPYYGM